MVKPAHLEAAIESCYNVMLMTSQFMAGSAARDGLSSVQAYTPLVIEALRHLHDVHKAITSTAHCGTPYGAPYGAYSPNDALRGFAASLVEIGNRMGLHPDGVTLAGLSSAEIRNAANEFIRFGSALKEGALTANLDGNLSRIALSKEPSLYKSEAILRNVIGLNSVGGSTSEKPVGAAELAELLRNSISYYPTQG